ncbi:probable inactive leucine-rich repeat receptor-like protein kinase At3g03770 isoform X2 [Phragmites australis]|uniref:probable inactive leucine-rich repeat receptor-like protein kinase At3g03770 isoform X2 n=1 Tax=Phragmites australis TaxID=29695 RepID=UPI002D78B56E|nr:probable inactive leucine-rich repeat receptor-like protein kinase At3g03770 isoform X2 [Phragmites australis]
MARSCRHSLLILLPLLLAMVPESTQLQSSQTWSLLKIQQLLNYPPVLSNWSNHTDFCYGGDYKTASAFVECYGDSVTQLHIIGPGGAPPLPKTFSIDAFFTTLSRLPDLRVLTLTGLGLWGPLPEKVSRLAALEIVNVSGNYLYGQLPEGLSRLGNLQTLIADDNMLSGELPGWLGKLPSLAVLSLRNNSLQGTLPESVMDMGSLRSLALASNNLSGDLPDLSALKNLQVIDLANNSLGPAFPRLGRKVARVVLSGNRFSDGLPGELSSFYLLEHLDVSRNRFVGPFAPALLALPSIEYLSIAGNHFTGLLAGNMSCGENLRFVDLSSNLLTGNLPFCLTRVRSSKNDDSKVALFAAANCLSATDGDVGSQRPSLFCQNQALAVGIVPDQARGKNHGSRAVLVVGIVTAALAGAVLAGVAVLLAVRKVTMRRAKARPPRRLVEHASSAYPSQFFADARYISQTMKLGALGIPAYRSFSLVELEAATNNFELSCLMGHDAHGQMYRGTLSNGTPVTIRSLRVKRSQTSQSFNRHIEMISKLRHRHLVSALGHCFEYNLDDSTVTQLYLVFEYVQNGNLRSRISQGTEGRKLPWMQRISAAIGVAKGIQFLHGGIMPGLFANNLKITNVLLDQNLVAKIGSYNIPILAETAKSEGGGGSRYPSDRVPNGDKIDIYDFGVILLEVVSGRPITSIHEVEIMKEQLQSALTSEGPGRKRSFADQSVSKACSDESLRTVMEICLRCLGKEAAQRPSVEDVLWNLQFAAQVQDDWRGDSQSSEESPLSPSQIPRGSNRADA